MERVNATAKPVKKNQATLPEQNRPASCAKVLYPCGMATAAAPTTTSAQPTHVTGTATKRKTATKTETKMKAKMRTKSETKTEKQTQTKL